MLPKFSGIAEFLLLPDILTGILFFELRPLTDVKEHFFPT